MLKKLDRQNQIISLIQQGHTMNASELAQHLNVSVRTISRDIVDLENQGVQIYAHRQNGGYQIQKSEDKIKLNFTEQLTIISISYLNRKPILFNITMHQ